MNTSEFTYEHLGSSYNITATYKPDGEDWELYEIIMEAPDGADWYTESKEIFVREFASTKMKSLADLIEDMAWDRFEGK